ncbi:hypothetical protein PUNSTDRAFT_79135 [Punctularia strigosozonata HHB-11173 SS5]|uniref:uncharacterized protein n=1 Tax=Punctularia strigosozonata (strain HHB-11173) TaxID=741275 RepID=UPI0004417944|nr:uncharacterized protein PUNSTDRAFT_79135 [Punctularia strigosozonata HHB-11173 SS5]EIN13536.1 hypothetical protein PUNSTDRAFT_79135 [Punctularia strigosozonata HHB-11173 SS5]
MPATPSGLPLDAASPALTPVPSESSTSTYVHRKTLPIKRADAEMLSREDVQFDLLHHIFSDPTKAFDDQSPAFGSGVKASGKVTFGELYTNILSHSFKLSKVIKDKMAETPAFATEFAKFAFLTNVGRINTTMAFFPEMKTALRSYHPVPSLQKTDGNVQDAPRIKNCLKGAVLPNEVKVFPPSSPAEVLDKLKAGQRPPTSVVNLIFVLVGHAASLGQQHFEPGVDVVDLFLPINIPSSARARAFLWLVYRYLEGPDAMNPFDDDYSRSNPGKAPQMPRIPAEEAAKENVDPPEEIEWGRQMGARRSKFLKKLVESEKKGRRPPTPPPPPETPAAYVPPPPKPRHRRPPAHAPVMSSRSVSYQPYPWPPPMTPGSSQASFIPPGQERTMLQQAWYSVISTDPLIDSDEEEYPDEHHRLDYQRRLHILSRLRGKAPTPEPEMGAIATTSGR